MTELETTIARQVKKAKKLTQQSKDIMSGVQSLCSHPSIEKKHGANTGNYDSSADCYWTDFYCPLREKRWTEDGSK